MEAYCFAYLDNIIFVTETFDEHLEWLAKVLGKTRDSGMKKNPNKCVFRLSQVRYLDYLVNERGLQVDRENVAPILEYPVPRNSKEIRRFLGMTLWYRRFIPDHATPTLPLPKLLPMDELWTWTEDQKLGFEQNRTCLTEVPVLACPNFEVPFELQTDASNTGLAIR